ncbi:MAG: hypothetical protein F6K17_09245 [Okeania sp. SIO3C4]|nr:hypothetical protein [Okeania sp. SIO3C4]
MVSTLAGRKAEGRRQKAEGKKRLKGIRKKGRRQKAEGRREEKVISVISYQLSVISTDH